jgi:hypothetical protein
VLKFFFWLLLGVNALLLAYGQGFLGNVKGGEREPARLKNQLNTKQLVLVSAEQAARAAPADTAAPAPASTAAPVLACVEIANVLPGDVSRVESLLAPLRLGERQVRDTVPAPEITSYIVHIPAQGGREGALRTAAELKNLGVTNYFIMSDSPTMKWAISLGVFKSEAAAQTLLSALKAQGVATAKVSGRTSQVNKLTWRLRDLDPETRAKVDAVLDKLPPHDTRSCR